MIKNSPNSHPQISLFDIFEQLDQSHPLIKLGQTINWSHLENELSHHYSHIGRGSKPIRLMCGILILKQLYNQSNEK